MAATVRITYVGPHDAVDVPAAGVTGLARGETVEVGSGLAASLLEQPTNWQPAPAPVVTKVKGA